MELKDGMATTWYLKPGQTLKNTKVSERKHALLATAPAWKKLVGQLDRKRIEQEARDVENARKQYLKDGCEKIVDSWNIKKVRIHLQTPSEVLDEEMQKFFLIRKDQEEEREKHVQEIRRNMYIQTGEVKNLERALLHSEVLYEREQQKKYQDMLEEYERMEVKKYQEQAKEEDLKHMKNNLDEVQQRIEKEAEHQKEILAQIKENLEKRRAEKAEEYIKGCEDNRNIVRHMEEIALVECRETKRAKELRAREFAEAKAKREEERLQKLRENEELDQIYEIYAASKCRIDEMRREKEKEILRKERERREVVQKYMSTAAAKQDAEEQRVLDKYLKEMDEKEKNRIRLDEEKKQRQRKEREENLREMREEAEKQKYQNGERDKWEILNRVKQLEAIKLYEENRRNFLCEKEKQHQVELVKQIVRKKEREEEAAIEKQKSFLQDNADQKKWNKMDELFLMYGDECMKKAKDRNRSTFPIEQVIAKYKKEHKLGDSIPKWQCTDYSNNKECPRKEKEVVKTEERKNTPQNIRRPLLKGKKSSKDHQCEFCV